MAWTSSTKGSAEEVLGDMSGNVSGRPEEDKVALSGCHDPDSEGPLLHPLFRGAPLPATESKLCAAASTPYSSRNISATTAWTDRYRPAHLEAGSEKLQPAGLVQRADEAGATEEHYLAEHICESRRLHIRRVKDRRRRRRRELEWINNRVRSKVIACLISGGFLATILSICESRNCHIKSTS
jgi:hypothetical protein